MTDPYGHVFAYRSLKKDLNDLVEQHNKNRIPLEEKRLIEKMKEAAKKGETKLTFRCVDGLTRKDYQEMFEELSFSEFSYQQAQDAREMSGVICTVSWA